MKRLAIIVNSLYNSAGMERVLTLRANALCDEYDITLISHNQGARPDFFPLDKRVHRIDLTVDGIDAFKRELSKLLCRECYDITTSTGGDEMPFLWKIHDGSYKIFEFHFSFDVSRLWNANIHNPLMRWTKVRLQTLLRIYHACHYDLVVALCKTDAAKWKKWCRNVAFVYNPISIFPASPSLCERPRVISVGRLDFQKGYDYLIKAWKEIDACHPDWQLEIWGDGPLREELQDEIDAKALNGKVRLCGRTADIEEKYLNSSIYVCSSRDEAFGLTIAEAEACGLPVVTFACPNAPAELVENGETGFVVSHLGDTKALAAAIRNLIESGTKVRQRMGEKGRAFASQFSLDHIMVEWKRIYG